MSEPLTKVDSAVQGLSSSPPKEKGHRRQSSSAAGVMNINDLGKFFFFFSSVPVTLTCRLSSELDASERHVVEPYANRPSQKRKESSCKLPMRHKKRAGKILR